MVCLANMSGESEAAPAPMATEEAVQPPPAAASPAEPQPLSPAELRWISSVTSVHFGRRWSGGGGAAAEDAVRRRRRAGLLRAVAHLERAVVDKRAEMQAALELERKSRKRKHEDSVKDQLETLLDPKAFKKLGHLHLVLENYDYALSAYEKYGRLCPSKAAGDVEFLYGKGLVYFHFNALHLAAKSLQEALYLKPDFERAFDAHARLGLARKLLRCFPRALRHLNMALRFYRREEGSSLLTETEIRFHIAHTHEIQGKHAKALKLYKGLLEEDPSLGPTLRSQIFRQMGWIQYSVDTGEEKHARILTAIQYLQRSLELDPKSGQCLYLLGRCYASLGKVHEAFVAYRNSVDKSESNADTWCSIGVLYQQQNQPMDALQAYICAVQLEKYHGPAWANLGMLYESTLQFQDALTCFNNAQAGFAHKASCSLGGAGLSLVNNGQVTQRIKYLRTQLSSLPPQGGPIGVGGGKVRSLPAVEEAWNLPVSNEMTGRHSSKSSQAKTATNEKKKDEKQPVQPLSQQQLQTLHFLQNQQNLAPQQQQILHQLQQHFQAYKAYKQSQESKNQEGMMMEGVEGVSDKELEAFISQQDIGSFAENLLKEIEADGDSGGTVNGGDAVNGDKKEDTATKEEEKTETKMEEIVEKMDLMEIPSELEVIPPFRTKLDVSVDLKADELVARAKAWHEANCGQESTAFFPTVLPGPPRRPSVKLSGSKDGLLPPTPSVHLENKKDVFSPQLLNFCRENTITVLRGIAGALKLDLGLFSTRCILEQNPEQRVNVMVQARQRCGDENWDASNTKQIWLIDSKKAKSTITEHASYQSNSLIEGIREEKANSSRIDMDDPREEARRNKNRPNEQVKIGVCPNISDPKLWKPQLSELLKLPPWARVVSAANMLSHVGYSLPESNTVSLMMKVPNARLSGRQEPNNFNCINMNIGPGECEWFAVPFEYWGAMVNLCNKHGVDFVNDAWWPSMKDLKEEEIPVYRFMQRPGDMVWVNAGCIYWVQSSGWCNSIKWNVGSLSHKQYNMALERYKWNRLQMTKSMVPMQHLSWNLSRNIKMNKTDLFHDVKRFLVQSFCKYLIARHYVTSKKVAISHQPRKKSDPVYYCNVCQDEVFALIFLEEEDEERQNVVCFNCAKMKHKNLEGFVCIEEYTVKELSFYFDGFKPQQSQQQQQQQQQQQHQVNQASLSSPTSSSTSSYHHQAAILAAAAAAAAAQQHQSYSNSLSHI